VTEYATTDLEQMTPKEYRSIVRRGEFTGSVLRACRGYVMADVAIVPKEYAFAFFLFCHRNPRVCGVLDVTEPGSPHPLSVAPDADLRTDLIRYQIYKDGKVVDEPTDITDYWRDDLVAFLNGCSGSFDWSLQASNVHYRTIGAYRTNIRCVPAGPFRGNMVVSCRLFESAHDALRAIQITSRHLLVHGPPVHVGDPTLIGIEDLNRPEMSLVEEVAPQQPKEIPLFWACGGTLRNIAREAKLPFMIVNYPGGGFVTDKPSEELAIL